MRTACRDSAARAHLAAGLAALAWLLAPASAHAWGRAGHRIICEVAWRELTPHTKSRVRELLDSAPGGGLKFNESCSWADEVRDTARFADDKVRHYVDAQVDGTDLDRQRDCPGRCVLEGIEHYARVLAAGGGEDRSALEALELLSHFVGDVHQPLHVGFASDRGGNLIHVKLGIRSVWVTNLHSFWDVTLVDKLRGSWHDVALRLSARTTDAQREAWTTMDPLAWAHESHALARELAYERPSGDRVTRGYVDARLPTVERRLQQAGVRLGALLNRILDGDPTTLPFLAIPQPTAAP